MENRPEPSRASRSTKVAEILVSAARGVFWILAAGILVATPWLLGGNGPDGYYWIVWTGRLCVVPLALWAVACALRKEMPGASFWVPVVCWSLLAVQVIASLHNRSSVPQAPWVGDGFDAVAHDARLPSTAFSGATRAQGQFWLALGLLALTARVVGLRPRATLALLWVVVINGTVLAAVGIPFKFSNEMKVLGRWPVTEWYFYSSFLYHNHWCAFALLVVAATAALFVAHRSLAVRSALVVAGIVTAGSAPLSTSRLGSLAMLAFGLVVIIAVVWSRRKRLPDPKTRRFAPMLMVAALLGLAAVGGSMLSLYKAHGAPGGHRTWASILKSNPFGIRQTLVEDTIPMLREKPWFGWGLGAYGAAFRFYQRPETRIVHNQGRITLYEHPHNDWLERWAELGMVGFSLFLAPGVFWLAQAWRHRPWSARESWILVGCFGLLIFALGDMVFVNRTVAASFAILFPLALGAAVRECRTKQ